MANENKEKDSVSGVETTGHEWEGIQELNNPAPRWWLWVFYVTIIWAVGYWVFYPAWPTLKNATQGTLGWTEYKQLTASQEEIHQRQIKFADVIKVASLNDVSKSQELYEFARRGGEVAFKNNCTGCHGADATGHKGYPNLNDDDWLWGGKLEDIYTTISYGIRSGDDKAHISTMPAFGTDKLLGPEQISDVADHVLSLSGKAKPNDNGSKIFQQQCASCHGLDGKGNQAVGAPNLTDAIWLYGGDKDSVVYTITHARNSVMPHWQDKLGDTTVKELAIYIHSLGGGK